MKKWRLRTVSILSLLFAIVLHIILFFFLYLPEGTREFREDPSVFKLVDIEVYSPSPVRRMEPPPPPPPVESVPLKPSLPEKTTERIEETDKPVPPEPTISSPPPLVPPVPSNGVSPPLPSDGIEYLPAHKISVPPRIPVEQVLKKIVYPPQANRQRIEGVVYLELFIDRQGVIRKIEILKDPGYGFAEAAVKAFEGVRCQPAEANGVPVAVRYRYPIRFKLR